MPDGHDCVELPTIINNVEYVLQSRTIASADGKQHSEYRVLLKGSVIKSWTPGNIRSYFSVPE
ncbi:hypothetical protein [Herbaspirillum sp. RV1423]|uniref:hypothetical protein n=1 Tax=Herbaspirillum sp. RV1423 TaxID=1443993 RepID=UPI0004B1803A|nr:hypothetical protein [Herbaspirillum sp. RV1423]